MAKKFCDKIEKCERCGRCCSFLRQKDTFTEKEDYNIRKAMFERKGILYAYPLERYGLGLSKQEAETFIKEAKKLGIKLKIKPKKILIDENNNVYAYDFFLDHDHCPFYKKPDCLIYELRPKRCKEFPVIKDIDTEEIDKFLKEFRLKKTSFEDALIIAKKALNDYELSS